MSTFLGMKTASVITEVPPEQENFMVSDTVVT